MSLKRKKSGLQAVYLDDLDAYSTCVHIIHFFGKCLDSKTPKDALLNSLFTEAPRTLFGLNFSASNQSHRVSWRAQKRLQKRLPVTEYFTLGWSTIYHSMKMPRQISAAFLFTLLANIVVRVDSSNYASFESGDGNFRLQWTYNSNTLFFNMTCKTTGWCAVGFTTSADGKGMKNYDIALGGVTSNHSQYIFVSIVEI